MALAADAATRSGARSSHFAVGCALTTAAPATYLATNVEMGPTSTNSVCAETSALLAAVAAEGPDVRVLRLAVHADAVTCSPCGTCRQAIHDLAPDAEVVFTRGGVPTAMPASDLLPDAPDTTTAPAARQDAIDDESLLGLIRAADGARMRSHSPYSEIPSGAAVLTAAGGVYAGCVVENAAYGRNTTSAELNAIHAARLAEGDALRIVGIVSVSDTVCGAPDGTARQTISEFAASDCAIVYPRNGLYVKSDLAMLLPVAFELSLRSTPAPRHIG